MPVINSPLLPRSSHRDLDLDLWPLTSKWHDWSYLPVDKSNRLDAGLRSEPETAHANDDRMH